MCCKNSDYKRYCKEGQAPFPYGPRRKLVCCQCPTGEVLNDGKNGCVSTGAPSPSSTAKPTLMPTYRPTPPTFYPTPHGFRPDPTYQPTPAPTYQPTPAPTYRPTEPPTHHPTPHGPTPAPSNEPTPAPTSQPTPAPTEAGTSDPPKPVCEDGFVVKKSDLPFLISPIPTHAVARGFEMCCKDSNPPHTYEAPKVLLWYEKMVGGYPEVQAMICYCINDQTWHDITYIPSYTQAVCR